MDIEEFLELQEVAREAYREWMVFPRATQDMDVRDTFQFWLAKVAYDKGYWDGVNQ